MENIQIMTVGALKKRLAELELQEQLTDETKVFLNTGWDSVQEIAPDALVVEGVQTFVVEDLLTKEAFPGYVLKENAEKMNATGAVEKALIINHLY